MSSPDPASEYVDAEQIAAELGVHLQTAQRYFRSGGLPGRKVGHRWVTTRAALNTWIAGGPPPSPTAIETPSPPPLEHKVEVHVPAGVTAEGVAAAVDRILPSGWTRHGHAVRGVPQQPDRRPEGTARCGGPGLCGDCSRESATQQNTYAQIGS